MSHFKIFYTKDAGEPFEFVYSSTVYVIQPPDKFWKRVKQPYVVGKKRNSHGDVIGEVVAERDVWAPDEDKNATGAKPKNWLYISHDIWQFLNNSKHRDEVHWLLPETHMAERMEDEKKRLEQEMHQELESKRRLLSSQLEKARAEHETELAKIKAQYANVEENVKRSLKVEKAELKQNG